MKAFPIIIALALAALIPLGAESAIASIDYAEGSFTLTHDGVVVKDAGIGDSVYDEDLIATGPNGSVTLSLAPPTGMKGTIKVTKSTSFYLRLDQLKGEAKGEAELISGSLSLKMQKLGGNPAFTVTTDTAVMAVRGTEFDVSTSVGGAILVGCSEGEVACTDVEGDGGTSSAVPGQVVEKREGQKLARRAVAVAELQADREKWVGNELAAFQKNAAKASQNIAQRYLDLADRLAAVHQALLADGTLQRWAAEEKAGNKALEKDSPGEIAGMLKKLMEARKLLVQMERIVARVDQIEAIVKNDKVVMAQEVRKGFTLDKFFQRFEDEKAKNLQRIAWLRQAGKIVKVREAERARRTQQGLNPPPGGAAPAQPPKKP